MSTDHTLVGHLPYLRRFARVLTGSQAAGDACVKGALDRMLERRNLEGSARIALYRAVLAEVDAADARRLVSLQPEDAPIDPVQRNLSALTPVGRQAFVLVALEEFTVQDAALVLGLTPEDVRLLIEDAGQDMAAQIATDVLIIEDEPLIALALQELLQDLGHRVVRVARTERQAIDAVQDTRPGLVLADIQLADGSSGLHAVNEILQIFSVPVIFVTAFPEKLLTGTKPEPTFLIRKPFQVDALKAVISQALLFDVRPVLTDDGSQQT